MLSVLYPHLQLVNSIPFFNYTHERSIPFRACDFFDELVARFASNPDEFDGKNHQLFSRPHIQELAEELLNTVSELITLYYVVERLMMKLTSFQGTCMQCTSYKIFVRCETVSP